MQNPANLEVTSHARALAVTVYAESARFPPEERFGITAQMRRAAISVGSNIAEGCGRSGDRELVNFLHFALGSATELEFQVLVATDLAFLPADSAILGDVRRVKRMLAGLIKAVRGRPARRRSWEQTAPPP